MSATRACVLAILTCGLAAATALAQVPTAATISEGVFNTDVYPEHNVTFPGGVTGIPDLTYYSPGGGFRSIRMDLYLPPASFAGPRPFVVYTHGGGWSGGSKRTTGAFSNWPGVLASLSAKGYVVASLDYRLLGDDVAPAAIQDTKAAIRFLRANATRYNIDKNRGLTWGPSAGGQLSALAGTSCGAAALSPPAGRGGRGPAPGAAPAPGRAATVETAAPAPTGMDAESDCVQGAVGWYGIYDMAGMGNGVNAYLGCPAGTPCPADKLNAQSPQFYVSDKTPPFLIIHGEKDATVSVTQAQNFYAALKAKGVKAELMLLPNIGHSWIGDTPEATRKASQDALEKTFQFIDATIGDKK